MEGNSNQYWLYQWIDECDIRTVGDCVKVARKKNALDRLFELSAAAPLSINSESVPRYSVVAGSRVDLSARLGCADWECLVPQVDYVFGRIWHYFDNVIVDALDADDFRLPVEDYVYSLQNRVHLLLYLRKIGAEKHIIFVPKPRSYCTDHYREHAAAQSLDTLFEPQLESQVIAKLVNEANIVIARREYGWHFSVRHPNLEEVIGTMSHDDPSHRPTKEGVAREVFGRYCNSLVADVSTSQALGLPLLQPAEAPWLDYRRGSLANTEEIAALSMRLPVLAGIPASELLKIRSHDWPDFELLRDALRCAIQDQQNKQGSQNPQAVATAVVEETVKPELARIERQLRIVKRNLTKKLGTAAFITSTATTVGAISGVPLVVAAGVAAVGAAATSAAVPQVFKYFDKRDKIKESNLYFLWRARVRSKH